MRPRETDWTSLGPGLRRRRPDGGHSKSTFFCTTSQCPILKSVLTVIVPLREYDVDRGDSDAPGSSLVQQNVCRELSRTTSYASKHSCPYLHFISRAPLDINEDHLLVVLVAYRY